MSLLRLVCVLAALSATLPCRSALPDARVRGRVGWVQTAGLARLGCSGLRSTFRGQDGSLEVSTKFTYDFGFPRAWGTAPQDPHSTLRTTTKTTTTYESTTCSAAYPSLVAGPSPGRVPGPWPCPNPGPEHGWSKATQKRPSSSRSCEPATAHEDVESVCRVCGAVSTTPDLRCSGARWSRWSRRSGAGAGAGYGAGVGCGTEAGGGDGAEAGSFARDGAEPRGW